MSITVKFFASLRERMGRAEATLAAQDMGTVDAVWRAVSAEAPPANTLVAVNQEYAQWDSSVKDGDEVAFFPPVTGG